MEPCCTNIAVRESAALSSQLPKGCSLGDGLWQGNLHRTAKEPSQELMPATRALGEKTLAFAHHIHLQNEALHVTHKGAET